MPKAFDAANPPFDRLTPKEVETLRAALDIAYFRPGEAIIEQDTPADALYVVIKILIPERAAHDGSEAAITAICIYHRRPNPLSTGFSLE